jgi:4-carboxymuconolactone decarboxylase
LGVHLAPLAAAAAVGDADAVDRWLDAAFAAGCSHTDVREAVLLLAPFGGFPRTLDALGHLRAAAERAGVARDGGLEMQDRSAHAERGRGLFGRVYGGDAAKVWTKLGDLDPELPSWVIEDAYGRVMSRGGLSEAQRERLAVVFLCALRLPNQLSGHVRGALRCGAAADEIERSIAAAEPLLDADLVAIARKVLARAAGSEHPA